MSKISKGLAAVFATAAVAGGTYLAFFSPSLPKGFADGVTDKLTDLKVTEQPDWKLNQLGPQPFVNRSSRQPGTLSVLGREKKPEGDDCFKLEVRGAGLQAGMVKDKKGVERPASTLLTACLPSKKISPSRLE